MTLRKNEVLLFVVCLLLLAEEIFLTINKLPFTTKAIYGLTWYAVGSLTYAFAYGRHPR